MKAFTIRTTYFESNAKPVSGVKILQWTGFWAGLTRRWSLAELDSNGQIVKINFTEGTPQYNKLEQYLRTH